MSAPIIMIIEKSDLKTYTEKAAYELLEQLTTGSKNMHTKELFDITKLALADFGLATGHDTALFEECSVISNANIRN